MPGASFSSAPTAGVSPPTTMFTEILANYQLTD